MPQSVERSLLVSSKYQAKLSPNRLHATLLSPNMGMPQKRMKRLGTKDKGGLSPHIPSQKLNDSLHESQLASRGWMAPSFFNAASKQSQVAGTYCSKRCRLASTVDSSSLSFARQIRRLYFEVPAKCSNHSTYAGCLDIEAKKGCDRIQSRSFALRLSSD